jgi:hypothetical protein
MFNNIKISYVWDRELALKSAQDIYEYELKNSNKKYIGWFFVALLQFGVVGALKHNAYGFLVISTITLAYWYGFRWPMRKYFINKTFDKSLLANKKIELEATTEAILSNGEIQILYTNIKRYIQLENAIVIYHNLGTIYLPNNAFESTGARKQFKSYLEKVDRKLELEELGVR